MIFFLFQDKRWHTPTTVSVSTVEPIRQATLSIHRGKKSETLSRIRAEGEGGATQIPPSGTERAALVAPLPKRNRVPTVLTFQGRRPCPTERDGPQGRVHDCIFFLLWSLHVYDLGRQICRSMLVRWVCCKWFTP